MAREHRPPLAAKTRANILLLTGGVLLLGAWHVALWATSKGLAFSDVGATLAALVHLDPVNLGEGVTTAGAGVVVSVWLTLVGVVVGGVAWVVVWRHRRRARSGMVTGVALKKRTSTGAPREQELLAPIAHYQGRPVRTRSEDSGCVIAPPRQGKTAYLAVGQVIDAAGAVVATSTKVDLLRLTARPRSERGRVWVFDPEEVSAWPTKAHWDIVAGCEDTRAAMERARAMVGARPLEGSKNAGFFQESAIAVLRCLLHAAALEGLSMREVLTWTRDFEDESPYDILRNHPEAAPGWLQDLTKFTRADARETVDSTNMSLSLVLAPLADSRVVEMVCPPASGHGAAFDPTQFVGSTDTLILLSEGGHSGVAPLITALVSAVVRAGRLASQRTALGRLSPAMTFVLDEVATIAPIPDLPQLMADGGGRGMTPWAVAQDMSQLQTRYGAEGAKTIWGSAAVKLLLGASSNDQFLESVSRLVGEHRITRSSRQYREKGPVPSYNVSSERERVLPIDQLRQIPEGQGLLLYRDLPAAIVDLTPWWKRHDAKALEKANEWALIQEGVTA